MNGPNACLCLLRVSFWLLRVWKIISLAPIIPCRINGICWKHRKCVFRLYPQQIKIPEILPKDKYLFWSYYRRRNEKWHVSLNIWMHISNAVTNSALKQLRYRIWKLWGCWWKRYVSPTRPEHLVLKPTFGQDEYKSAMLASAFWMETN